MCFAPMAKCLLLMAAVSNSAGVAPNSAAALPEPIATRQTAFAIPFRIDAADRAAEVPVEVQLFVSRDRGSTWEPCGTAPPTRRHFLFRADADGEYSFAIRTLLRRADGSMQLRPQGAVAPGLQVVVDTARPNLQLQATRGSAGQITARWQLDEQHPRPDGLSIEYRTAAGGAWQKVALAPQNRRVSGSTETGKVTWWLPAGPGAVEIRAEVADAAGNTARSDALVDPASNADPSSTQSLAATSPSWRAGTADTPSTPWPADRSPSTPWAQNATTNSSPGSQYSDTQYPGTQYPDNQVAANHGSAGRYSNDPYRANRYASDSYASTTPAESSYPRTDAGPSANGYSAVAASAVPPPGAVAARVNPPLANQYVVPPQQADPAVPPTRRPRMVNKRLFELAYDVSSVGPSGIAQVELWGTRNGGRNWESFALDDDNRSPLLVSVDREGIYGFRVVVRSGAGLGGNPPHSGDLPEVVIGVDLTDPTARILAADQGIGPESGHLIITWTANDQMLADRPVTLSYSDGPGGRWTTIAEGLQNTGRYAWPLDGRLPQRIFLRLDVRDEAGNVGVFETAQAISLDRLSPVVQIRDVRPVGQTTRRPPQRYYFR